MSHVELGNKNRETWGSFTSALCNWSPYTVGDVIHIVQKDEGKGGAPFFTSWPFRSYSYLTNQHLQKNMAVLFVFSLQISLYSHQHVHVKCAFLMFYCTACFRAETQYVHPVWGTELSWEREQAPRTNPDPMSYKNTSFYILLPSSGYSPSTELNYTVIIWDVHQSSC